MITTNAEIIMAYQKLEQAVVDAINNANYRNIIFSKKDLEIGADDYGVVVKLTNPITKSLHIVQMTDDFEVLHIGMTYESKMLGF